MGPTASHIADDGRSPRGGPAALALDSAGVMLIEPPKAWKPVDFDELWRSRELLYFIVWRDIKVRYKQTVVGAAWSILRPLVSMVIFSVIFGKFAGIPSDGVPYPVFVFAGLLPWMFFSGAVAQAGMSLVTQAHLLTKVYFPRLLLPASSIGVGLVDLALGFLVYVGILIWYAQAPGLSILLLPLLVLLTAVAALGVGLLLASVTVIYRDFRFVIPFLVQTWMFLSPVVYPISLIPERYQWILALNPMTGIIQGFRSTLLNRPIDWPLLGTAVLVSTGMLVIGVWNFRRAERRFADVV
jgi:lipopolysaccharide transport system permease protein